MVVQIFTKLNEKEVQKPRQHKRLGRISGGSKYIVKSHIDMNFLYLMVRKFV